MAVGDIINDVLTSATWVSFQPSAGTEIMILMSWGSGVVYTRLEDGVNDSQIIVTTSTYGASMNMKMGITNTNYGGFYSSGGTCAYSGIQIK
tara:strand:+ start:502 stop:777 length:276 start_codon:yes stop_codon:yes gene_type:complete